MLHSSSRVSCLLRLVDSGNKHYYYRAMHFSAKRGITTACRPSVRVSVTLVDQDHIGWKSWKLIARPISLTPSLFVAQRNFGVGKVAHKSGNISENVTRIKIDEKLLWRAWILEVTNARSNGTIPDPHAPPFPSLEVRTRLKLQSLLFQER